MKRRRSAHPAVSGAFVILCAAASSSVATAQALPAFPGADGPGATATGGRGGDVYHVTRLDADKNGVLPGSLQYGINNAGASGRTIVFDVAGTIYLAGQSANDTLRYGRNNITIAGQTAPGPGITIAGTGTKWTGSNVILRNITIRPNRAPVTYDAFSLQLKNSIVDHVTATWFTDEGISITDAGENTTVQYANISEGLHYGGHSFGSIITTEVDGTHYSFNHNLYAHNASRMPRVGAEIGQTGAVLEFSNNVIYNWSSTKVGYGGENQPASTNLINNYYVKGYNNNTENLFVGDDDPETSGVTKVHESGNKLDGNRNGVIDGNTVGGRTYFRGGLTLHPQAFNIHGVGATRESADVALQRVLDYGGANWNNRNPIDARIVNSVRDGSGRSVTDLSTGTQAREWATVLAQRPDANGNAPFTRPAGFDTDGDGMPDAWEALHGTNPAVANHNGDFDADGYRDIEEYINELGEWPAATPVVFTGGTSTRYALIHNWNLAAASGAGTTTGRWQPNRFDVAQVRSGGTAVVDAVGQHARILQIAGQTASASLNVTGGWIDVAEAMHVGTFTTFNTSGAPVTNVGAGAVTQTGGVVGIGNALTLGGTAGASGTYNLQAGTLAVGTITQGAGGTFNFTGGTLAVGIYAGNLTQAGGTLAPAGTTTVTGNYAITSAAAAVNVDIAGITPGTQFHRVNVAGAATLGGVLRPQLAPGFIPAPTDSFTVITYGSRAGVFASIANAQIDADQSWSVHYDNDSATLLAGRLTGAPVDGLFDVPDELLLDGAFTWTNSLIKLGAGDLVIDTTNVDGVGPGAILAIADGTVRLQGGGALVLSELEFGDIGLVTGEQALVGTMGFYASVVPEPSAFALFGVAAILATAHRARHRRIKTTPH